MSAALDSAMDPPGRVPRPPRHAVWQEVRALLHPSRATLVLIALSVLGARALDLVPPVLVQHVIDDHLAKGTAVGLLQLGLWYLGATAAGQVMNFVAVYLTARVAQGALHGLRVRLMNHLQRLPLSYYDQTPLGETMSRCTADVETVETLFATGVINLVGNLLRLGTAAVAMVILSRPLSLIALLVVPPLVIVTRLFQLRVRAAERANRQAVGMVTTHLQETLGGVEVIQAFGREATFGTRFRRAVGASLQASSRSAVYSALYTPTMAVLAASVTALLLWAGAGGLARSWDISVGTLTAFVLIFGRFFEPITTLGDDWQTVQSALSGIERIVQLLAIPPETLPAPEARVEPHAAIELRNVVFGYVPAAPVLRTISFVIQPGEQVTLVGRTGSGKSSVLSLIAGLYTSWSGRVQVAGYDPRTLVDSERRRVLGVVPQTVQLFSGTVWENLTLGDTGVSHAAVERAARVAGIDTLIAGLPEGYATALSGTGRGGGAQLSAGQRQLLALARALVWAPQVLLLDEATDAIDSASDATFRAALRREVIEQGCTVLTVAHRLATARTADRVIVLEAGRIVEVGPPEDLLRRGGYFAALVELEAAGWNW